MQARQSLTDVAVRSLERLAPVLERQRPDVVLVQGDTTTTFTGALSAFYHRIPVVHLEAGLRTHDVSAPFPEEMNRRLTTHLATLHLAPTAVAKGHLMAEGVPETSVIVTGNTVIDALLWVVERSFPYGTPELEHLDDDRRPVLLVTAHRRETWGRGMSSIARAVGEIARSEPGLLVVFPVHQNPAVRDVVLPELAGLANVLLVEPLPYGAFARLMARSWLILTDSGGIQEEGPSLGKPVLVMRDVTERPEAVAAGTARLVGTETTAIVSAVRRLLADRDAYAAMAKAVNPYGDGRATERTMAALRHLLDGEPRPEEFSPSAGTAGVRP
jgi:UDP-N-acetylglucosamine 2-epimerase (non-hydrolysing)